jgi:hypothetical protein
MRRIVMELRVKWCAAVMIGLIAASRASAVEAPGTVFAKDGRALKGIVRWVPASKEYAVGTKVASMTVPLAQVESVAIEKPAELDAAIRQINAGQPAAAVPVLERLVESYAMMQWDQEAATWLAKGLVKLNQPAKAADCCRKVIAMNPDAGISGALSALYWDALLACNREGELRSILNQAVVRGSREVAAIAQIKRGDMDKKAGRMKPALVDGYLRTVLLFQDIKTVQPEALYKAMKCFEEMGQAGSTEQMRRRLLEGFPGTDWAVRAKSGGV